MEEGILYIFYPRGTFCNTPDTTTHIPTTHLTAATVTPYTTSRRGTRISFVKPRMKDSPEDISDWDPGPRSLGSIHRFMLWLPFYFFVYNSVYEMRDVGNVYRRKRKIPTE